MAGYQILKMSIMFLVPAFQSASSLLDTLEFCLQLHATLLGVKKFKTSDSKQKNMTVSNKKYGS